MYWGDELIAEDGGKGNGMISYTEMADIMIRDTIHCCGGDLAPTARVTSIGRTTARYRHSTALIRSGDARSSARGGRGAALIALALASVSLGADPGTRRSMVAGAESWETRTQGIAFSMTQILPDQVRGFYGARGFDPASVEEIARACVFQTVLRNESVPQPIRYRLGEWRALTPTGEHPPRLQQQWQDEWERRGISPAARTAFRWALLPTEQTYATGDWNMGMTLFTLPHGSRFDVRIVWYIDGKRHEALLKGVRCATDSVPGASPNK